MNRSDDCSDLLFEIGMAEVPARFLPGLTAQLADKLLAALGAARLTWTAHEVYGGPRRAAVIVRGIPEHQPDQRVEVRGPAVRSAFGRDGTPGPAALGFARSQAVAVESLVRRETAPGAEYLYAIRIQAGLPTAALLPDLLGGVLVSLQFARSMRWGSYDFSFVRPVRWLLGLYGRRPLHILVPGLPDGLNEPSGCSRGHRFLAPGPVHIETPAGYVDSLRTAGVIVDPAERRTLISRGAMSAAALADGVADLRGGLLEELVWLAEQPAPLLGAFDSAFLDLPEPVLVTVMEHHQRFVPVRDSVTGMLLPSFVGVRDGGKEHLGTVRSGYERVLRARLADARFFCGEDRKRPLAARADELSGVVYHEQLGTMAGKTRRLVSLVGRLSALTGVNVRTAAAAERAAALAKCDLVTQIVRELPELQGRMGAVYARLDGEPDDVCRAIGEQYLPAGEDSGMPSTPAGLLLAVADRLDALVGHFYAGVRPSGSQDPYGLRRAASGIVAVLLAQRQPLALDRATAAAAGVYAGEPGFDADRLERSQAEVLGLLRQRLEAALADAGLAHDEVAACLSAAALGLEPVSLFAAGLALSAARGEAWFRDVAATAVRAAGLGGRTDEADGGQPVVPDPALFVETPEAILDAACQGVESQAGSLLAAGHFAAYWRLLGALRGPVDAFFDGVLVMAPDQQVRRNRLLLCRRVHRLLAAAGDLSLLVWPGDQAPAAPGVSGGL